MAEGAAKQKFPMMSTTHWWSLRDRFKLSLPRGSVSAMFLATALSSGGREMSEASARTNVLPPLRIMGLIQEDGTLNEELANLWRTDEGYSKACSQILEHVYPHELLDALPPPSPDPKAAQNWFMSKAKVGQAAGKRMAETYRLLCEADYTTREVPNSNNRTNRPNRKAESKSSSQPINGAASSRPTDSNDQATTKAKVDRLRPAIHIDVQIHISPDSSNEQIETIFANMAKHLFGGEVADE